jgi:hypothetical protein
MAERTVVARVLDRAYVRVIGATRDEVGVALASLRRVWSQRGHALTLSTHDEHKDWFHIRFPIKQMKPDEVSRLAFRLRDDLAGYFKSKK